jgi:tetratricopeptide (TPR) repeat protein
MRTLPLLVVLCLLSFSAFADPLTAGRAAMERHDWDAAAKSFEQAIAANPKNAEAHYLLGGAYGRQAQDAGILGKASLAKKAKTELETAVQLDPNHVNARFALIDFYTIAPSFMGGSNEKALAQAAEIKKRDRLQGHRAFARVYARQEKMDLAQKEMVEAVREEPNNPAAHQSLGMLYLGQKKYNAAIHEFEIAMKLDATYMPAHLRIGQALVQSSGDLARADAELRKYLGYKPTDEEPGLANAWYWLGMLQEKQGRKADARQSFTNAGKLMPGDKNITAALKRVQ